jgi:hypothetical protein
MPHDRAGGLDAAHAARSAVEPGGVPFAALRSPDPRGWAGRPQPRSPRSSWATKTAPGASPPRARPSSPGGPGGPRTTTGSAASTSSRASPAGPGTRAPGRPSAPSRPSGRTTAGSRRRRASRTRGSRSPCPIPRHATRDERHSSSPASHRCSTASSRLSTANPWSRQSTSNPSFSWYPVLPADRLVVGLLDLLAKLLVRRSLHLASTWPRFVGPRVTSAARSRAVTLFEASANEALPAPAAQQFDLLVHTLRPQCVSSVAAQFGHTPVLVEVLRRYLPHLVRVALERLPVATGRSHPQPAQRLRPRIRLGDRCPCCGL